MKYCLLVLLLITGSATALDSTEMQTVEGTPFTVFFAGDEHAERGMLMVHDWFGVSDFYLASAERMAQQGFRVIAVDLYDGERATTHARAWELLQNLDTQLVAAKLDRALAALGDPPRGIAVMGFSMGAPHALAAALRNPERIHATLLFYGDTIDDVERLQALGGPVLSIYGSLDGNAAERAALFSKAMDAAGKAAEIYIYPGAHHAFAQPLFNQGATYDPAATAAAWQVVHAFVARRLPGG